MPEIKAESMSLLVSLVAKNNSMLMSYRYQHYFIEAFIQSGMFPRI
jgi:hypothetical protein